MDAKTWTRLGEMVEQVAKAALEPSPTMRETRHYRTTIKELAAQIEPEAKARREQYVMARDLDQSKTVVSGLYDWYINAQTMVVALNRADGYLKDEQRHIRLYGADYSKFR